jgi:hypothetical protein
MTSVTDQAGTLRPGSTVEATWMIASTAIAYRTRTRMTRRRRNFRQKLLSKNFPLAANDLAALLPGDR